jgi:hypothetical protein
MQSWTERNSVGEGPALASRQEPQTGTEAWVSPQYRPEPVSL